MPRGVPQIEVVFDLDANGILNVSATEKSSGRSNKITIKNDKGRLSPEEIERMVNEAEQFKDDDKKVVERIESKNKLEGYLYQVKSSLNDENLKDKIDVTKKEEIEGKVKDTISWLDENQNEEKEVYESRQKEIEDLFMGIMKDVSGTGTGMPGGMPEGFDPSNMPDFNQNQENTTEEPSEPVIEEID